MTTRELRENFIMFQLLKHDKQPISFNPLSIKMYKQNDNTFIFDTVLMNCSNILEINILELFVNTYNSQCSTFNIYYNQLENKQNIEAYIYNIIPNDIRLWYSLEEHEKQIQNYFNMNNIKL